MDGHQQLIDQAACSALTREAVRVPFNDVPAMLRRSDLENSQIPVCLPMATLGGAARVL